MWDEPMRVKEQAHREAMWRWRQEIGTQSTVGLKLPEVMREVWNRFSLTASSEPTLLRSLWLWTLDCTKVNLCCLGIFFNSNPRKWMHHLSWAQGPDSDKALDGAQEKKFQALPTQTISEGILCKILTHESDQWGAICLKHSTGLPSSSGWGASSPSPPSQPLFPHYFL
jgi:hypothetical protein